MASLLTLPLLLLSAAPGVASVVVYPDRAQVTRAKDIPCGPRAAATFEGLPPAAAQASLRARVKGGSLEGLTSEVQPRTERYAPALEKLDAERRKLEQELSALQDQRARGEQLARVGDKYAEVAVALASREMVEPRPDVRAWSAALEVAQRARLQAVEQDVDAASKLRELQRRLEAVRRQQRQMAAATARRELRAEVLVSCPAGKRARVELTYLVGGASWEPAYEARANEAAGTVELSTYATVRQATGEDWSRAALALSTAVPLQNATPPELQPLRVWAEERKPQKKVLVRRDEYQEHVEEGGEGDVDSETGGGLRAAGQGLSVQLTAPEPANVPGDGTPVRLLVARSRLKASFAYRTVPKQLPFVFRVADLTNTAPLPLLPGPLDAYRQSGFIARYHLERVAQGGRFHLTFGIEEGLRVKRTVVEELQRDAGLFGSKRRFRYAYRFEVSNHRGRAEQVELAEHIPVSELDDIQVEVESKTTPGYKLAAEDGIATWKLKLAPGEKKRLELVFHVDVPSSYDSGGI